MVSHILRVDFPGVEELRLQLDRTRVVAPWSEGSVSVDLEVVGDAPRAPVPNGIVPVDCVVVDEDGELFGEIILWNESGMLSGLEYAWFGDHPPRSLPRVDRMITSQRVL